MSALNFATIRKSLLFGAMLFIGFITFAQQFHTRSWSETLQVTVFPINADGKASTQDYIDTLSDDNFRIIDQWGVREAQRYNLALKQPFSVKLGEQVEMLPPPWPVVDNQFGVMFWGLRFRWWAFNNTPDDGGDLTRIRMFVMYQSGENNKPLQHSLGMQKGLIGLVHAYSLKEQAEQNNVVIAHEMLHTVGAIDKYNESGDPLFPTGFVEPQRRPLYPQFNAEIMSGRVATSAHSSYMVESLHATQVNPYTAADISWLD